MKKILFLIFSTVLLSLVNHDGEHETGSNLHLGEKAPKTDIKFAVAGGDEKSLTDVKQEKGLVVIFTACNCPFVVGSEGSEGWQGRYNGILEEAKKYNIGVVLVNSNAARRDGTDSPEKIAALIKEQGYQVPVLIDNGSELADAFGAKTTPHVFFFGKDFELVYTGAIDDNVANSREVKQHYLKDALHGYGHGHGVTTPITKPQGCSIKRVK